MELLGRIRDLRFSFMIITILSLVIAFTYFFGGFELKDSEQRDLVILDNDKADKEISESLVLEVPEGFPEYLVPVVLDRDKTIGNGFR